jgi:hypothetical protein
MPSLSKLEIVTEPLKKKVVAAKKPSVVAASENKDSSTVVEKKVTKPRAKKATVEATKDATPATKSKKTVAKKETDSSPAPPAKKAKTVSTEKKVAKKPVAAPPVEPTPEESSTDANATSLRLNYNIDNKGFAYRTFKLISVDSVPVTKEHSATQSSRKKVEEYENKDRIILCPRNAASKIFTSWSYSNNTVDVTTTPHVICIKETTRKSMHRDFYYRVIREAKLNEYCVTSPDGKKKNICSKFTNRLTALKKSDIQALSPTSVAPAPETVPVA